MGNYYSGIIYLYIDSKKISLEDLLDKVYPLINTALKYNLCLCFNGKDMSDNDLDILSDYDNIDINRPWETNYKIPRSKIKVIESFDDNIYGYAIVIICNTKYFGRDKCEESIIELINALKPYKDDEYTKYNVGTIKDEDHYYKKDFVWDYEEFKNKIKSREYLCRECCNQFTNNSLCSNYDICKRAYDIGYENGHKDNVMYWDR